MSDEIRCDLLFSAREKCARKGEPVSVGLPWPKGAIQDDQYFHLIDPVGKEQMLQTKVLDRWADGSVRWCLFDLLATIEKFDQPSGYSIVANQKKRMKQDTNSLMKFGQIEILFQEQQKGLSTFDLKPAKSTANGSIRFQNEIVESRFGGIYIGGYVDFFRETNVMRLTLQITNTNQADHPAGNWDLGNGGSIFVQKLAVRIKSAEGKSNANTNINSNGAISISPGEKFQPFNTLTIHQNSSGGENWNSSNHISAARNIPMTAKGFQLQIDGQKQSGNRANPIVVAGNLGFASPTFWENFPKKVTADDGVLEYDFFPADKDGKELVELQGGEQKTHVVYIKYETLPDPVTEQPMMWCRSPMACFASPDWYAKSGAVNYLTPKEGDPNKEYLDLVQQALDGPDTFVTKREKIDEYGWRHFGDIYGDHEAVKHTGHMPMISHYNNQYDCVAAFLYQFMRSGDLRWMEQGLQCADHTCDIDIYHTKDDKAAYNGGLFWHTYHYVDADTGTHRSYPKMLRKGPNVNQTERVDQLAKTADKLQKAYAVGGGPSSSHNYNAGLMLAYYMTGNPIYSETAINLADFVFRMEDPSTTPFRFLSRQSTGLASDSGGGGYHGPGRASANSILALITGHKLTGDQQFLNKAEQIIRRVVSPKQNLEKLDLLNAELRWYYTMHLQAMGAYLDHKIDLGQLDEQYAYAQATLLHYAKWMAANERPILDTPEKLQFPTETWAAQDMRKVEVFQFAAKHSAGAEKEKYLERAEFFFRYIEKKLPTFATKSLCRPVILMMKYGWTRRFWQSNPATTAPGPKQPLSIASLPEWKMFLPQKKIAMKRAKRLAVVGALFGMIVIVAAAAWFFLQK